MPGILGLQKKYQTVRQKKEGSPTVHQFKRHLDIAPIVLQRSELWFIDFGAAAIALPPVGPCEIDKQR